MAVLEPVVETRVFDGPGCGHALSRCSFILASETSREHTGLVNTRKSMTFVFVIQQAPGVPHNCSRIRVRVNNNKEVEN